MAQVLLETSDFYQPGQAFRLLQSVLPRATFFRWLKTGKIITVTFVGRRFVPRTEVERILKQEAGGRKPPA